MKCYPSKWKALGLLGLTCVMVGMCYFCTTMPGLLPRVVGWSGVVFFGLGFVVAPIMMLRNGPQVIISDEGIEDRRQKLGVIRWEEIRSLSVGSVQSAMFLRVELSDPERTLSRLPPWKRRLAELNRVLGFPGLSISFSGLSPGLREAWAHLQVRAATLRRERSRSSSG